MDDYSKVIDILNSDDCYMVKNHINELINDQGFIDRIIIEKNPFVFDRFMKMCEYKIDTSVIYERRDKYIYKLINKLTGDNYHEILGLKNTSTDKVVKRFLTEYIVNYYFHDNYYNVMSNFFQMIKYLRSTGKKLVSKDHINLYNEFVRLLDLPMEEQIKLFYNHSTDNIIEMFYDDMTTVKEDSHKELVDKTIKLTKHSELYQKDTSERLDIDVYMLDGEDFYGFVRCLAIRSDETHAKEDYVLCKSQRLGYSFSYIGSNNIGTIDDEGKNVTLFYDNIDYRNIMYVHHADLHAGKMEVQDEYLSEKENEIFTPNRLVAQTKNYNEVYIKAGNNGIYPTALVCYDRISTTDIAFAKKYNLAILVIMRNKYKKFNTYDDDYNDYSYVI